MATVEETLRKLGLSAARGVPQLATGFVDLAALPFTMTGVMKPEQAVGSTAYLTSKGLLPPPQEGVLAETTELLSSAVNPATAVKSGLIGIGGTFIGKNAKSWNKAMESKFLDLEKQGFSPADIWKQTGTLRAPDGKLRQEVSDKETKAFFTHLSESGQNRLAEKAIQNPQVEAAYPQLGSITQFGLREKIPAGSMEQTFVDNKLSGGLMIAKAPTPQDLRSASVHEMQHAIQGIEGFAQGQSLQGVSKSEIPNVVMKKVTKLRDSALDLYGQDKIAEGMAKEAKANKLLEEARLRAYLRSAGEVESRLAQRRIDLTDQERLANYPYARGKYGMDVNPKKVIVKGLMD